MELQAVRNAFMAGDCKAFHEELRSSLRVALSPAQPQAASPSHENQPQQPVNEDNLRLSDEVPPAFALPRAASEPARPRRQIHVPEVAPPVDQPCHVPADSIQIPAEISPVSILNSTPSSGRPGSTPHFHSANEETGFESASSNGQHGLSDDDRPLPSATISKTSLTAAESETSVSTFNSSLRPVRAGMNGHPTIRNEHFDELSTPITPIAEDHGSVGNDEADEQHISESNSSEGSRPADFVHARRAYLDEAALRASIREALAKGQSKSQPPPHVHHPAHHWVTNSSRPAAANRTAEANDHVQLFETGYLNSDGSGSDRDAEAYDSESVSEPDELDGLAEQLQVGSSASF